MKRVCAFAIGLVLFVAVFPAAAACCIRKPGAKMAAMHASMPCCSETCRLTAPNTQHDRDITLTSTASVANPMTVELAAPASLSTASTFGGANAAALNEFSAPPSFLIHHQFRI